MTATETINTRDPRHYHVLWQLVKHNTVTGEVEVKTQEGNLLLTVGITELLRLLVGDTVSSPVAFSATNAFVAVGDGTVAANVADTDLKGANKYRQGMEAGYPQVSGNQVTWRAKYGTTSANFAWQEYGIANAQVGGVLINRKVENLGTKNNTDEWTLTVTITLS